RRRRPARQAARGDLQRAGAASRRRTSARGPSPAHPRRRADGPARPLERRRRRRGAARGGRACRRGARGLHPRPDRGGPHRRTLGNPRRAPERRTSEGGDVVALTWLRGLAAHRRGRLLATALGVAAGVALLASIGAFLSSTTATMTTRAIAGVPVDWQIEAQSGSDPAAVLATVRRRPGVRRALPVQFATTTGLTATTAGSTQQTGSGRILGVPPGYPGAFPGELRLLAGTSAGVVLAQQTAANLHAGPGDTVRIGLGGRRAARVRVDGIVDLP